MAVLSVRGISKEVKLTNFDKISLLMSIKADDLLNLQQTNRAVKSKLRFYLKWGSYQLINFLLKIKSLQKINKNAKTTDE